MTFNAFPQQFTDGRRVAAPEQALWAAVVLATIDEAVEKGAKNDGPGWLKRWVMSPDGHEVLRFAGVEPSRRVADLLHDFAARGQSISRALAPEDSSDERRRARHRRYNETRGKHAKE